MKFNFVLFTIAIFATINYAVGSLEPETEQSKQFDRKSAKGLDDDSGEQPEEGKQATSSEETEEEQFIKILADDLNFPSGGIKIVKAPDLSKDNEGKKITDQLAMMLESQEKWIQKIEEELEEINKNELAEDMEVKEKTPDEIEGMCEREREIQSYVCFLKLNSVLLSPADNYYEQALTILNKTKSSNRAEGFSLLHKAAEKGHKMAKVNIAWAHLLGNPLDLRIESAKTIFEELAESGMAEAHMGLGFMYATGIGYNASQAKALVHYTVAAIGDNAFAQMVLGYRYWAGVTVANSCEKALDFYRKVATKVASEVTFSGGAAIHRVRLLDEVENSGLSSGVLDNDLIDYYELLANKGDIQAQVGLGQLHYQGGRGIPLDHRKALSYFLPAANAGNAVAMGFLGKIYLEGSEHIKADNDTAFKVSHQSSGLLRCH
jgi:SEL1 protein